MNERLREEHRSRGALRGELFAAANLAEAEHARGQTQRAIAIAERCCRRLGRIAIRARSAFGSLISRATSCSRRRSSRGGCGGARSDRTLQRLNPTTSSSGSESNTSRSSTRCAATLRGGSDSKAMQLPSSGTASSANSPRRRPSIASPHSCARGSHPRTSAADAEGAALTPRMRSHSRLRT